jgi:hypothetical protein
MRDSRHDEMRETELEVLAGKLEQQVSDSKTFLAEAAKQLATVRSHLASVAQRFAKRPLHSEDG